MLTEVLTPKEQDEVVALLEYVLNGVLPEESQIDEKDVAEGSKIDDADAPESVKQARIIAAVQENVRVSGNSLDAAQEKRMAQLLGILHEAVREEKAAEDVKVDIREKLYGGKQLSVDEKKEALEGLFIRVFRAELLPPNADEAVVELGWKTPDADKGQHEAAIAALNATLKENFVNLPPKKLEKFINGFMESFLNGNNSLKGPLASPLSPDEIQAVFSSFLNKTFGVPEELMVENTEKQMQNIMERMESMLSTVFQALRSPAQGNVPPLILPLGTRTDPSSNSQANIPSAKPQVKASPQSSPGDDQKPATSSLHKKNR